MDTETHRQQIKALIVPYLTLWGSAHRSGDLLEKTVDWILGDSGQYDRSILGVIDLQPEDIQDKHVLDIGAGGLSSTLDLLEYSPASITVIEPRPFSSSCAPEDYLDLLALKTGDRKLPLDRVRIIPERLEFCTLVEDLQGKIESAFYFFPHPLIAGGTDTPELKTAKSYSGERDFHDGMRTLFDFFLSDNGTFTMVTEMTDPNIYQGISTHVQILDHPGGVVPVYPKNNLTIVRPMSDMNLKVIKYQKES